MSDWLPEGYTTKKPGKGERRAIRRYYDMLSRVDVHALYDEAYWAIRHGNDGDDPRWAVDNLLASSGFKVAQDVVNQVIAAAWKSYGNRDDWDMQVHSPQPYKGESSLRATMERIERTGDRLYLTVRIAALRRRAAHR